MKSSPSSGTTQWVALLRGINVGGHHAVKMAELTALLEALGGTAVKTVLASGNVAFSIPDRSASALQERLEKELAKRFGLAIPVLVRTQEEMRALVDRKPFAGVTVTPDVRLYVTFLSRPPGAELRAPFTVEGGHFSILQVSETEVCSVVKVSAAAGTVAAMEILEKRFGRNVTTRNWNTIEKLVALGER